MNNKTTKALINTFLLSHVTTVDFNSVQLPKYNLAVKFINTCYSPRIQIVRFNLPRSPKLILHGDNLLF